MDDTDHKKNQQSILLHEKHFVITKIYAVNSRMYEGGRWLVQC